MKYIKKFNENSEYGEIFDIVKSHCECDDDDLIEEAIAEAENSIGSTNNNSDIINFVNGYVIGVQNYKIRNEVTKI
jgi:hypothetical protein